MMMHMPMFVLDQLFDNQDAGLAGCPPNFCRPSARATARSCSGPRSSTQASKPQPKAPVPQQQPIDTIKRANFRELTDTYLIWADLPGLAREDVSVTVKEDILLITGQQKTPVMDRASSHLQAALCARPRKAVDIKIPLKNDAKLEGIHAKLINGELTIAIPKRVPQHFSIPVLGGEDQPSSSASTATLPSADPVEVTHTQPTKGAAEPARASKSANSEPGLAAMPFPNFVPSLQEAAEPAQAAKSAAADLPEAARSAAAEPSIAAMPFPDVVATLKEYKCQADETPVTSDSAAAPAEPKPASAPAAADKDAESDGSWEDVSDEERKAERSSRRRRALPPNGPVLEEIPKEESSN